VAVMVMVMMVMVDRAYFCISLSGCFSSLCAVLVCVFLCSCARSPGSCFMCEKYRVVFHV